MGVEDLTGKIIGVGSKNRKNQQNVIEMIMQKPRWAGGYHPQILVRTLNIDSKEIDIIIIKQCDNTPFYLLEDYTNNGTPVYKGAIYTRRGDANTPRNKTADISETTLLWKRRFGLLYQPSQRGKFYLKDIENWKLVEGDNDKSGRNSGFYFYQLDPDYTIHFENFDVFDEESKLNQIIDIIDKRIGARLFYLYSFEANSMLRRVIPVFTSELEQEEFEKYIGEMGFSRNERLFGPMNGEALRRFSKTKIENIDIEEITYKLQIGKMLVDWLGEWRENQIVIGRHDE